MTTTADRFEQALLAMDRVEARRILDSASADQGPMQCVEQLLVPALEKIGDGWEQGVVPLAQVYMSGRICEELMTVLLPQPSPQGTDAPMTAICVLEDFHSLGKTIVCSALRASGIELHDFGQVDVATAMQKVVERDVRILLVSVLMLPSAIHITELCARLKREHPATRVIVGGAPFRFDTNLWREVGADTSGATSADAVRVTRKMLEELS